MGMLDREISDAAHRALAMSDDEMKAMALAQAEGARQANRSGDYMRGQAQNFHVWPLLLKDEPPKPKPLTKWQRIRAWWREFFRKNGAGD